MLGAELRLNERFEDMTEDGTPNICDCDIIQMLIS